MAHSDFLTKNLGWRLLLLLFWTVLVCCILYASKGKSSVSVLSKEHIPAFSVTTRLKRVAGNVSRPLEECKASTPSREELGLLERAVRRQGGHASEFNPTVHCSVVVTCDEAVPFRAHCFSRECRAYKIRVKNGIRNVVSLSSKELSHFVESSLQGNSFTTIEDLGWYMDIRCQDPKNSRVKITGDVLSAPQCQIKTEGGKVSGGKASQGTAVDKINVLYFRFLSQWELPIRFPGLFSLIQMSAKERNTSVIHFDKYQATQWGDDETLSLLLRGDVGPFIYNSSLLDALHINGYCFRLEDFSCSKSRHQQVLIKNVSSYNKLLCGKPSAAPPLVDDFCAEDNSTDSEIRALLTSLLSDVHDVEAKNGDAQPLLSISILNTKDFRHSEVLDHVLMNLFANVLGQDKRTVLLMSDVGNPVFLRFDVNVRLQTQASNPALLLLSTDGLSEESNSDAGDLQRSPFSMLQLHHFLKHLVQNKTGVESAVSGPLESYDSEGVGSCGGLNVKPPFTCLCEGQFVNYDNDTLMAGFAEFAVSMINTQLQHVHPGYYLQERSHCARLSGVSFTNVRVAFHNNKRRILMDINLENELFKDRVLRRIVLDIWDADKIPRAAVQVLKADPLSLIPPSPKGRGDDSLKTLCQTGERLDHPTSSETGLLKRWSQEKHLGHRGKVTHVHDSCLHLLVRDFGDSISVEAANVCGDRSYDVVLHLSLINMMSLSPLPLSASLGHGERRVVAVVVKVAYTVPTFAFKLHPDFHVTYDD